MNERYLDTFIAEANEHLQSLNHHLLELEKSKEEFRDIDKLFRAAHSLKGMAGAMNFTLLVDLTHALENVFDVIRKQNLQIEPELIDILFQAVDQLELIIRQIEEQGEIKSEEIKSNVESLASKLDETTVSSEVEENLRDSGLTLNSKEKKQLSEKLDEAKSCFKIKVTLNEDSQLLAARAFTIINMLQDYGRIIKSYPELEVIKAGELKQSDFELIFCATNSKDKIRSNIMDNQDVVEVEIRQISFDQSEKDGIDSTTESTKLQQLDSQSFDLTSTVRVNVNKLDDLMNLVGELMINKSRIMELHYDCTHSQEQEALENAERVTNKLHRLVMDLRMIPLSRVMDRFPRMVRDLAKEMGKKVELEMEGQETELDRIIVEELGDPLVQLLRNCIDHGIEKMSQRKEKGKDEVGKISIVASQQGNEVKIVITDDGSGIDVNKIQEKAIKKGIITSERAQEMGEEEIIDLIFTPGFSTSQEVTDISGRGVGLDIVRSTIESLGGQVGIDSEVEKGTKFVVKLPVNSAIIQALLIKVAEETYVLPLNFIDEVYNVAPEYIKQSQGEKFFLLRNDSIHLVQLREKLGFPRTNWSEDEEICIVVISNGDKKVGLVVDELIGQQKIVVKSLNGFLNNLASVSGATILGNGEVALILNTRNIV